MRASLFFACTLLLAVPRVAAAQSSPSGAPETVIISSGNLHLRGLLWKPAQGRPSPAVLFLHGSGTDAAHTSGLLMTDAAAKLAPLFVRHGYAFLYLCRRGQGLSADQGTFIQDALQRENTANGDDARKHLQLVLLTTDQLDDALAGLAFLKSLREVDARRIAVVGHSFGGQLTILVAEHDSSIRAAVTFGAAANSWENIPGRDRLLLALRHSNVPIMLVQAANDYSIKPGKEIDAELTRLAKPHVLEIYPAVGQTPDDGHNLIYTAPTLWEADVFTFLDRYVGR
jgi:dienelactone hydrolase